MRDRIRHACRASRRAPNARADLLRTLRTRDRLFCVLLAKAWPKWRTALVVVQADTVVRWHRQWLRRHWTERSMQRRPGRPSTAGAIRTLVDKMGTANPLWGAPRIHGELVKLGGRRVGTDRVAAPAPAPSSTATDVANVLDESRDVAGFDGFLHRADPHGSCAVRPRAAPSPRAPNRAPGDHRTPDSRMDGATGRLTPFRTTRRRAGSSEIAMPSMATHSGAASLAWP
jgi:hypothetical protein